MKKILLSTLTLLAFVVLAAGCVSDGHDNGPEFATLDGVTLAATFDIPDARATRAYTALPDVEMWVLVFSEAGNYLSRHRGSVSNGRYTFEDVPVSEAARTLHFVANPDFDGFSDSGQIGRSESEVMLSMSVGTDGSGTPAPVAYWQRVVLEAGTLDAEPDSTVSISGTIHLLRNVAQVTVTNATDSGDEHYLTDVQFAVGNRYDRGTVAPYDTSLGGGFGVGNDPADGTANDDDFVTEATDGDPIGIVEATDFVSASGGSVEMYERKNSTAEDNAYVIIRAHLDGGAEWSYYKVEIVDAEANELLDIGRNWSYRLTIESVADEGYSNLADAVSNLASNNVTASVVASEYTDISNGTNVLHVDRTHATFVRAGQSFEIGYFFKDEDGVVDNSGMSFVVSQSAGREVVVEGSVTVANGVIRGTTAGTLPNNDFFEGSITISKGGLSRTISLRLRQPMNFIDVRTTPADGVVANVTGEEAAVHFKFPDDISQGLFPIPVRIYTRKFTPDPAQGLTLEYADGEYWYVYNAPWLGVGGEHTVELVANSRDTDEGVRLESELFLAAVADFDNGSFNFGDPRFRNTNNSGDLKPRSADNDNMRFYFTMPQDAIYPVTVRLVGPGLDLESGRTSGLATPTTTGSGAGRVFNVTVNAAGRFYFTVSNTSGNDNTAAMYLEADGFTTTGNLNQ
ncbi:MAG: hypothetical protein LBV38_05985 [Alistipes sp.]|jgi:hypothetical protein|nr:hypothetical protein [Alistipes sp.]